MSGFHLFTLANVPVRMSLGYLLLAFYFAYLHMPLGPEFALVAILCLTLSLLVHEFGHALVARRYRLSPAVMLHGWGGLCFHKPIESPRKNALIIVAGPLAGLAFGILLWAGTTLVKAVAPGVFEGRLLFDWTLKVLIFINIYWSLLNLIPLWPLDGGQLFRLGAHRRLPPARAERLTHQLGAGLGIAVTIFAMAIWSSIFLAIIGALLAFENIRRLTDPRGGAARPKPASSRADELLSQATDALNEGEPREARRLAFLARDEQGLSDRQLDAVWTLLTVSSAAMESWDDALHYSLRAPRIAPVFHARIRALAGLGRHHEARRELGASDAPPLPPRLQEELEALLRGA